MLSGTVNNVLSMHGGSNPRLVACGSRPPACKAEWSLCTLSPSRPVCRLSFRAAMDTPAIQGNEDAIRQIILNLVCNAIRHTPRRRHDQSIDPRAMTRQGTTFALVEVADTGCGIPDELIERLFEAGFSAHRRNAGPWPGGLQTAYGPTRRRDSRIQPGERRQHISIGVSNPMTRDDSVFGNGGGRRTGHSHRAAREFSSSRMAG